MAILSPFPTCFFSLSSHKLFAFPRPSLIVDHHYHHHQLLSRRRNYTTICASSIKKPKASRKVKSNADLCNDLREFVSAVGLPEGHVPSTKELSHHGRKDLANIVRRRGYKLLRELLANSTKTGTDGADTEKSLTEKQYGISDCEDEPTGQDEKGNYLAKDVSLSSEDSVMENYSGSANINLALNSDDPSYMSIKSSVNSSLQEKVAKFIHNGELDTIEAA